jgi:hypothetical protein
MATSKTQDSVMREIYTEEEIERIASQLMIAFSWGKNNLSDMEVETRIKEWEMQMKERYLK